MDAILTDDETRAPAPGAAGSCERDDTARDGDEPEEHRNPCTLGRRLMA